ncbi:hypothetical protein [Streptomyces sp. NPDC047928]|uniref:hypothetical protein n=1 Tax=unclassified Streptomyces TaxID=2593676 RepID=UPI00371F76B2
MHLSTARRTLATRTAASHRIRSRAAVVVLAGILTATGAACTAPATKADPAATPATPTPSATPATPTKPATPAKPAAQGKESDAEKGAATAEAPESTPDGASSDLVSLAGDYGPDTCREGYVWREARRGDHVCVEPRVRDQARTDNARAAARRSPGTNGNGPDACAVGYVWREAYPGDVVCVVPAVRTQARADNAQADDRRVSTRLWKSRWYPARQCEGDTCVSRSDDDIPRIRLNGDHYNFGQVRLVIRRTSDNRLLWSGTVTAARHTGFAGGSFGKKTSLIDCSPYGTPANGYAQAYDVISNRWSARLPVSVGCSTL